MLLTYICVCVWCVVFIVLLVSPHRHEISVDTFSETPVGYTGLCTL